MDEFGVDLTGGCGVVMVNKLDVAAMVGQYRSLKDQRAAMDRKYLDDKQALDKQMNALRAKVNSATTLLGCANPMFYEGM
jgi:hypothetical protein